MPFYSAAGWMTYISQLALVSWFLIASISMVWKQEAIAPSPLERHATNLLGLIPITNAGLVSQLKPHSVPGERVGQSRALSQVRLSARSGLRLIRMLARPALLVFHTGW